MAAAVQMPLNTTEAGLAPIFKPEESLVEIISEVSSSSSSEASPSSEQFTFIDNPVVTAVGKQDEVSFSPVVEVAELDPIEDLLDQEQDTTLSRSKAIQALVDGQRDIEDAVHQATEAAILEDLEDQEACPAVQTSYQDNVVYMNCTSEYRLRSATYEIEDLSMPEGQDPCNVCRIGSSQRYTSNEGNLEFPCGRLPSTEVAEWWNSNVTNSSASSTPTTLNFALSGTLTLTIFGESLQEGSDRVVLPDFSIAQGYEGKETTWLFGSKHEAARSDDTIRCQGFSSAWGNLVTAVFRREHGVSDKVELLRIEYI